MGTKTSGRLVGAATRLALAFSFVLVTLTLTAPAARAQVQTGVPPSRLARLRRGVNLSHWFSQSRDYSERHLREHTTRGDIELIKSLGFDHVRFPVEPAPFFNEADPSELNAGYVRHLDAALDMLLASGLAVVLDLHPSDEFKIKLRADDRAVSALADFWRSLARHVAARDPERLFLEIMNEPMAEDPFRWMGIQARVAAAMREGAPRHTIVATGPRWSSVDQLLLVEPVSDRNVVYNFHFYEPHNFTHQGATWGADFWPHLKNIPYPSSPETVAPLLGSISNEAARGALREYGEGRWDAARVEREIARAAGWARARGVALTCNEFGVYRAYSPPASRLRWIADVRAALERHRIGWAMWDYAGGFGVAVRKDGRAELDPETAHALGLRSTARRP
ncbi:MAG TPA: cellulase family glycosylhydrolase [Pyrinomonadaceae bacterium]|nr:cellulase family glycosylhydrolase [Pyrinomonadaceae bacterium]